MLSQWRKALVISAWVSSSALLKPSIVLSEKTTPQPKVSSHRFRSMTVISHPGLAFFARMEKYSPAGPPPRQTIFIGLLLEALSNQHSASSGSLKALHQHYYLNVRNPPLIRFFSASS